MTENDLYTNGYFVKQGQMQTFQFGERTNKNLEITAENLYFAIWKMGLASLLFWIPLDTPVLILVK